MARIKAFKGIRPRIEKVKEVASRPYDVLNTEEAIRESENAPYSFLHVVKPEINFPLNHNPYAKEIYERGLSNFENMMQNGVMVQDEEDALYLYELTMNQHVQTGIVACASIDDYFNGIIKKHELTRPDKEEDRKNHVRIGRMHAEPVFFAYKKVDALDKVVDEVKKRQAPVFDFVAADGIRNKLWKISDVGTVEKIISLFDQIPSTYVADGHHRTAAAALVGKEMAKANPNHTGTESYNYFLAVHFPDDQLQIIDYNRVVKDLNGLKVDTFLEQLQASFDIVKCGKDKAKPSQPHEFGMYLDGHWYKLKAKEHTYNDADTINCLDVTVLSNEILGPILGIQDLRTDKRIDFVGGIRGLQELEQRVDSGDMKVAFALFPVSMQQLMNISDNGLIMPPKTTWFEPKLRSGLVVHTIDV